MIIENTRQDQEDFKKIEEIAAQRIYELRANRGLGLVKTLTICNLLAIVLLTRVKRPR